MTHSPFSYPLVTETTAGSVVTHEAIANRAQELWTEQGCPEHCDEAIWLEAEAELLAIQQGRYRHPNLKLANTTR